MKLRKNILIILILSLCLLLSAGTAMAKPVTITFWHAMSGSRLGVLESIIESFNATHPDYEVKPLFTGSYAETLTKYVTAYPTKTGPNMVQVYEVGTHYSCLSNPWNVRRNLGLGTIRHPHYSLLLCRWKPLVDAFQLLYRYALLQQRPFRSSRA